MNDYVINIFDCRHFTASEFKDLILQIEGLKICELTIEKVLFNNGIKIYPYGIYIFKRDREILYVGKCSSTSYARRIFGQFDTEELQGWGFNALLKHLRELLHFDLVESARYIIKNGTLIFVPIENNIGIQINEFESKLRCQNFLNPTLNKHKNKKISNESMYIFNL